jgi:hypothetical protein
MTEVKIKTEKLPNRCEICHQSDEFDALNNFCRRCSTLDKNLTLAGKSNIDRGDDIFKRINANLNNNPRASDDLNLFDYLLWWVIKLGILAVIIGIVGTIVINFGSLWFRKFQILSKMNLLSAFMLLCVAVFVISGKFIFSFSIIDKLTSSIFNFINRISSKEE